MDWLVEAGRRHDPVRARGRVPGAAAVPGGGCRGASLDVPGTGGVALIDHLSLQVRDVAASAAFYDTVLAPLGGKRMLDFGEGIGYASARPTFWIAPTTTDGEPREAHVAFIAADRAAVH